MRLSVADRLALLNILPQEGDITTLKIVRKLREELSFSEEEHAILQFQNDGQMIRWNPLEDKDVEVGEKATDIISDAFKELNKQKKISVDWVELYERFVKE